MGRLKFVMSLGTIALAVPAAAATPVAANLASPTSLGSFAAGKYSITASSTIDLAGDGSFTVGPDGTPTTMVTNGSYIYCNPGGCDFDAVSSAYGVGGPGRKLGSLLGTLTATPSSPADYFLIGFGTTVTLAAPGTIYAQVNDTFYPNNIRAFDVSVTAVPEPTTWVLLIGGFAVTGTAIRRRNAVVAGR